MIRPMRTLLVVAAAAAALSMAPIANADNTDDVFIHALNNHGVTMGSSSDAIAGAHDVCNLMRQGYTQSGVASALALHNTNISQDDAGFYVQSAVAAYCPILG